MRVRSAWVVLALGAGCSAPPSPVSSAATHAGGEGSPAGSARQDAVAALASPPWFSATRGWPIVSQPGFLSEHDARTAKAEVRVSPAAAGEYRALGQDSTFAPGSVLMETLQRADGRPTQIFALERRAEDWLYWVLDGRGRPLVAGQPPTCRACHSAALAAPVFGLPRLE